jgi:hypothetical protein
MGGSIHSRLRGAMVLLPFLSVFGFYLCRRRPQLTTTATVRGEEVYMSYGSHTNDFLLVECQSQ